MTSYDKRPGHLGAGLVTLLAVLLQGGDAAAVRPFVTDDARIVSKGQLEFPAHQIGLRWYKTPEVQWDLVWLANHNDTDGGPRATGAGLAQGWNHTLQIGFRILFDDVFRFPW